MAPARRRGAAGARRISGRAFTAADQVLFASLSGDVNPMHMDPLAARRTQAGDQVVHGVHALLWALERTASLLPLESLCRLKVKFTKFIYLGRPLEIEITRPDPGSARVVILDEDLAVLTATLRFGLRESRQALDVGPLVAPSETPAPLTLETMKARAGWLTSPVAAQSFRQSFPRASAALDPRRLSGLAQMSRLVGMVCPGLHSIFSELSVQLSDDFGSRGGIGFETVRTDARFRSVDMDIAGDGLAGRVSAFARHPPIAGPSMDDAASGVHRGEFAGVVALIVGGSRGLGAVTAKVLAAGGGRVIVTYAQGRDEATTLCTEINNFGRGAASTIRFDVRAPALPQLIDLGSEFNQLYYFATPHIFSQKSLGFSRRLFDSFLTFYVFGFGDLCAALKDRRLTVFYPSSVAVTERPKGMAEYAMAKAAGEILCAELPKATPGLEVLVNRLPRILTDQTATVAHVPSADPVGVMLPIIRAAYAASSVIGHG